MVTADNSNPLAPAVRILLKVVPGSRKSQLVGMLGDRLKIKVASPPEDGRANREVCELLASHFGVPARNVTIIAGQTRPEKSARIEGISVAEAVAKLPA